MTLTAHARSSASRVAAWTCASGIAGLLAAVFVVGAAQLRAWRLVSGATARVLFASHDVATIVQSLLLLPAAWVLYIHYRQQASPSASLATAMAGVALCAIALLQSLWLMGLALETLYMIPQGLVGVWVIAVNWSRPRLLSAPATWVGTLAGVGLVLIAASFLTLIGYFGFEALTSRIDLSDPQARLVNRVLHLNLYAGTGIGKPLYPIWVLLLARGLPAPTRSA